MVENRPGAGTTIGIAAVGERRARRSHHPVRFDGAHSPPTTVANIPYDVMRDLIPIAPLTNTPLVMVTHHGKFKDLADLVGAAKAGKHGAMNYATNGYGSASHFTTERFRLAAGSFRRSR